MSLEPLRLGFIGFGEAASAMAAGFLASGQLSSHAYDIAFDGISGSEAAQRLRDKASTTGTTLVDEPHRLAEGSDVIFSLVTCTEAVAAAQSIGPCLKAHHVYVDLNSTSPQVKREVAQHIQVGGFVEGAIMSVVPPQQHKVPILMCGEPAPALAERLVPYGMQIEVLGPELGSASAAKMFRSIVMKGLQGLFVECLLASRHFGVQTRVFDSISHSFPGLDWNALAHYFTARGAIHGERQGHEMEEVARTLEALGEQPLMAKATAERLLDLAAYGLKEHFGDTVPPGYHTVLDALASENPKPAGEQ